MSTATQGQQVETRHDRSVLSGLSLLIGIAMVLSILTGIAGGLAHVWRGQVAVLILMAVPVCSLGTGLAIASLVWRKESHNIGQAGLWLNGLLAFFAFP